MTAKDTTQQLEEWGNLGFVVALAGSILYTVVASFELTGDRRYYKERIVFDPLWKSSNGYCVTAPDTPYWTSHDVCLYADIVTVIVSAVLYKTLKDTLPSEANTVFLAGFLGHLFHGFAHGGVAYSLRTKQHGNLDIINNSTMYDTHNTSASEMTQTALERFPVVIMVGTFCFWLFLLKTVMSNLSWSIIALYATLVGYFQLYHIPDELGFVYVQSILLLSNSICHLVRSSKEKQSFLYATMPWIVTIPVMLAGWLEGTSCSAVVKNTMYGHLMFDTTIGVTQIVWYLVMHHLVTSSSSSSSLIKSKVE